MSALPISPEAIPAVFVYTSNTAGVLLGIRRAASVATRDQSVGANDVRAQLAGMLASRTFERMARISQFLAYLVEQTIAGEKRAITEYNLGIQVFRRDPTFDPYTDAIVRVQARRLRRAVERYYETEGENDSVLIEIPPRSYTPRFSLLRRAATAA